MKINITYLLLFCGLTACNSSVKQYNEFIDRDNIKLNGFIPTIIDLKTITIKFGKPDSVTPDYDDVNDKEKLKYVYFKGVQFEKYNDTLTFKRIDFKNSPDCYISYRSVKLDSNTRFVDFKKLFPISAEKNELSGTDQDKNQWIKIAGSIPKSGDEWDFLFDREKGNLIRIEYIANH